jgi:hypothetical protein
MNETRLIYDPFTEKHVEISDNLTDRLRGRYAIGPKLENGEPEFGWREHDVPPIQIEAAERIEEYEKVLQDPVVVHLNMLRGGIAKPSVENILHLYPEILNRIKALEAALFDAQQALITEGMARDKAEALAKQLQERLDAVARVDNSLAKQLRESIEQNAMLMNKIKDVRDILAGPYDIDVGIDAYNMIDKIISKNEDEMIEDTSLHANT